MKYIFPTFAFYCLNIAVFHNSLADNLPQANEEDEDMSEMLELMEILEEETSIATKSKVNSDYVPGMVTVLNGDDMEALGKRTVWEALALVPGIKTLKNNTGTPLVVARSVPFPFNSGNIKIMVNSTTMSSEISGINSSILLFPIEQVERIEVIRGPSSSIYGNSAYLGVVNIITRKNTKLAHLNSREGSIKSGGGQYYWSDPKKNLHVSANLFLQNNKETDSPVESDAKEDKTSFIFGLDYEQTSITAQWFERKYDLNDSRPLAEQNDERAASIALKQSMNFSEKVDGTLNLSFRDNHFDANKVYEGSVAHAQMDLNWEIADQHSLLIGFTFEHYNLDEATLCVNSNQPLPGQPGFTPGITPTPGPDTCPQVILGPHNPPPGSGGPKMDTLAPPPPHSFIDNQFLSDESWNTYSLSIQDQYALSKNLTLTAGIGFNRNSNINESNITPRLAFVWQMADHHLFKGQYSKGFRSPTYFELYDLESNKDNLESEQIDSYELGYIYKHNNLLGRVTLFHYRLSHLIYPDNSHSQQSAQEKEYLNDPEAKTTGIELEWEQKINRYLKWSFNVTYSDSKDTRSEDNRNRAPAGVSNWLGNVSLYLQPKEKILVTAHYYYVGDQTTKGDRINGYKKLDLTLNLFQFLNKNITLRAGVKNLLDDEIIYFDTQPSTTDGVEYPGRTWWAQLSYKF